MNNFDDLFEQRPQAEAAPQKQKSQKERPKRQWWQVKEEKHRKEAYATLDKIFGEFSEGTGSMEAYGGREDPLPGILPGAAACEKAGGTGAIIRLNGGMNHDRIGSCPAGTSADY